MPLTPDDVHKKTFTPVRLREGYDMGEVDQFLDEVETELIRLHQLIDELRGQVGVVEPAPPASAEQEPVAEAAPPVVAEVAPLPVVRTVPEASSAAARLLEIATNNADQLVNEARDDADRILGEARTQAEQLESDAKSKAERLEADARTRSEKLDSEVSDRRHRLFGELEQDKETLTRALEDLRSFEREYRTRLRGYFEAQLLALDGDADAALEAGVPISPLSDSETPRRLRELLGEEE